MSDVYTFPVSIFREDGKWMWIVRRSGEMVYQGNSKSKDYAMGDAADAIRDAIRQAGKEA